MARFSSLTINGNRSYGAEIGRRLACLFLAVGPISWAPLTLAAEIKLEGEACPVERKPKVPVGELLAQAEDLRDAANRLRQYDYDKCYQMGRSCFAEVDSKQMTGVEDDSYRACRSLEVSDRANQAVWLEKKKAFIGCVIADLEQRAQGFESKAKNNSDVGPLLDQLKGHPGNVDAATLTKLGGNVTWCSTRDPAKVRVLCKDGTGLLAEAHGQQFILWRVDPTGRLCFVDFDGSTTCGSVTAQDGLLTLTSNAGQFDDVVKVVPRIGKPWSDGCSQ